MKMKKWMGMTGAVCGLFLAGVAHGANGTWNPTGTPANNSTPTFGHLWSDTNQWTSFIIPGTTNTTTSLDTLNFLIAGHYTIELDANHNVKYINSNPGGHGHAFGTQNSSVLSLTSGGAINSTGGGNDKYFAPIRLEGGDGGSYTFSGDAMKIYAPVTGTATAGNYALILSGAGAGNEVATSGSYVGSLANGGGTLSVIKTGTGVWFLNNNSTYTGTTTVRNGRLKFQNVNSFGTGASAIQLGDNGTGAGDTVDLEIANNITFMRNISVNNYNPSGTSIISVRNNLGTPAFSGTITLNRNLTVVANNSGSPTFSGKVTGTGGIIKTDLYTLTLSNTSNDYQGATTINGGVLAATVAGALSASPVTVNGGVLRANQGVGLSSSNSLSLNGGVWESSAAITRFTGPATNQVQLANYAGFSANGATVNVNLNSGATIVWGSTAGFNPTTLVLNETTANSALTFQNALDLNGANRTIAVNHATQPVTISNTIVNTSGTAGLIKTGAGILNLTGNNTFNGGLTLNAGTLTVSNSNTVNAVTVNAGTLTVDYANRLTGAILIPATASLTMNGGTFSLSGSGSNLQTTVQTVAGLTLAGGNSTVSVTPNNSRPVVLNLGAITRSSGSETVNFVLPAGTQDANNGITTPYGTASTKLGLWATVSLNGTNEWAAKDAANVNIVPWSSLSGNSYQDVTRLSSGSKAIASNPANDLRIIDGTGSAGNITNAASGTTDISNLLAAVTGGTATYNPGATDVLRLSATGTVSLTGAAGTGALTLGTNANNGILTAGGADNTAGVLTVVNNHPVNLITVYSSIANNGTGAVGLKKMGPGILAFSATAAISPASLSHSGGTQITEGTLRYTMRGSGSSAIPDYGIGTGIIGINGATLHADYIGNNRPGTVRLTNSIMVGLSGATFNMRQSAGASHITFSGPLTLDGNLRIEGQILDDRTVLTTTLGGTILLTNNASITFASPSYGSGGLNWNYNAITGVVNAPTNTLTLTGPGQVILSNGGANFNAARLTADKGDVILQSVDANSDFLSALRGNTPSGGVAVNAGYTLTLSKGGHWRWSDFMIGNNAGLYTAADDAIFTFDQSFTIGSGQSLTWCQNRKQFVVAGTKELTVADGGLFRVNSTKPNNDCNVDFDGKLILLGGSTFEGVVDAGLSDNPTKCSGIIQQYTTTSRLILGDGNPATAETLTIQGVNRYAADRNRNIAIAIDTNNVTDDGNVKLRYVSLGTDTNQFFNIQWGNSFANKNVLPFRGGSAGTEFAPGTGNAGIAVVGPATGDIMTITNLTTLTTAGTVGFYRTGTASGTGFFTSRSGTLGSVVVTNGGTLAFTTNGTVLASNVTFRAGAALNVKLTGASSNACSLVNDSGALTFESNSSIAISEAPGLSAYKGPWLVAKYSTQSGLPKVTGGAYAVSAVNGYIRIDRRPMGTLMMIR